MKGFFARRTSPGLGAGSCCPRRGGGQRGRRVLGGIRWSSVGVCLCSSDSGSARVGQARRGALGAGPPPRSSPARRAHSPAATLPRAPPPALHAPSVRSAAAASLRFSSSRGSQTNAAPGGGWLAGMHHWPGTSWETPGSASRRLSCAVGGRQRPRCPGRGLGADDRAPPTPRPDPPSAVAAA